MFFLILGNLSELISSLDWSRYIAAACRGVMEHAGETSQTFQGLSLLVDGIVPPGSGLSSSSSLVCAAALALMHANGLSYTREELAALCAKCEDRKSVV